MIINNSSVTAAAESTRARFPRTGAPCRRQSLVAAVASLSSVVRHPGGRGRGLTVVQLIVSVVRAVVRRLVHDQVVAVLHRRVFDVVLVPGVLDERRAVVVPVEVRPVLVPVVRVVVGLEERVEQQHLADDCGHQRQHDEDFDLHQYHAQHAREHRPRGGQVALDPSAGLCNREKFTAVLFRVINNICVHYCCLRRSSSLSEVYCYCYFDYALLYNLAFLNPGCARRSLQGACKK